MTKVELKKIMSDNYIFNSDWMDAIQFVQDLLEFKAREIEETEPYAINTIKRLRDSAYEVWNLLEYVESVVEQEEV